MIIMDLKYLEMDLGWTKNGLKMTFSCAQIINFLLG